MPNARWCSTAIACLPRQTRRALRSSVANGASSVLGERVRVAVIGVGHLGRHHARILSSLEGTELVAVVDTDVERAAAAANATGASARGDFREIFDQVDAVTIAVPTELHRDVALPFLEQGTAVLVEKPMARSLAEAD